VKIEPSILASKVTKGNRGQLEFLREFLGESFKLNISVLKFNNILESTKIRRALVVALIKYIPLLIIKEA
jgi:hypothetical protein